MAEKKGEPPPSVTAELDAPLHAMGFLIDVVSPSLVNGRFTISPTCCLPFGVLHGGISALVAEALASIGAQVASGFRRVAGVQLGVSHHRPGVLGDHVLAEARPISVGKSIQVWEVKLWKTTAEGKGKGAEEEEEEKGQLPLLLASSRVTLLANLPVPETARSVQERMRKHAKL